MPDIRPLKENIQPTLKPTQIGSTLPVTPFVSSDGGLGRGGDDFLPPAPKSSDLPKTVTTGELYDARKFAYYDPTKTEDDYAYAQSAWDKAGNGLAKLAGTTGITIADNTVGLLYGTVAAIGNQKFSSLYDNDFFKAMDKTSEEMENKFPHYYTEAERKDPLSLKSVFTGNFFWDKIIKNLGFAAGAAATGYAAGAALEALGLSRGLVAAGKAMQALEASETAIAEGKGLAGMIQALKNPKSIVSKFGGVVEELGTIEAGTKMSTATRGLSAFLGTTGEAGLESYQNAKDFRENSINKYKETYGKDPEGKDLEDIEDYAAQVGNWSFGLNALLLTATEYIQLPKIFGSTYSGEKRTINNLLFNKGAWERAIPTGARKYLSQAGNAASLFFNTAEAFEEGAQYAIQVGTNNFFDKKYRGKEQASFWNSLAGLMTPGGQGVLGEGVEKALTTQEGLENVLLGGLSGALMTAGIVGMKRNEKGQLRPTVFGTGKIGERGVFGYGGERGKFEDEAVTALNTNKLNTLIDSVNRGISIAEDRDRTLRQGDILNSKDLETDYMLNYLLPRIKYGGKQMFDTELDYVRQRASTDFTELQKEGTANENDSKEAFIARLESIRNIADQVNENYTKFKTSYSGIALTDKDGKPVFDDKGNLQRKYNDTVIDKMVYTVAKIFDYNNRIPQLTAKLAERGISVDQALAEINLLGRPNKQTLKTALDAINEIKDADVDDLKTALTDAIELTQRRNKFFNEFNDIKTNPAKYEEKIEPAEKGVDTVKVKQIEKDEKDKKKTVTKELEIGKEYSLNKLVARAGDRLMAAPKLTVLAKTLNGEYEVRMPDGSTKFLKPIEFKQYQVTEQSLSPEESDALINSAIDNVLARAKYRDVQAPTENKLEYVNSLDNQELLNDIEKEADKLSEGMMEKLAKEEELAKQKKLQTALDETSDVSTQTADPGTRSYEPNAKKTDQEIPDSTKPPVEGYSQKEALAEHHVRANQFGANFYTFPNRDNFRAVIVTQGNEKQLGIPGLTQWLKDKGKKDAVVDPTKTIALVIMAIDPVTNEKHFVGVDGKKLDNPTPENTIYQTFPEKLTWEGGDSMFRETTSDTTKQAITDNFNKWREATLKNPSVDLYKVTASFGSPQYVGELDDKGKFIFDYKAKVPVESSNLVTDVDIRTKNLITVPTTDGAVVYGSSTFNDVKGVPLLRTHNGLVRLNNRNITKAEAELIYEAIAKLANNLFVDGDLKSNESIMLYNWLKSVIYWGTPKDPQGNRKPAGFSSVFFENMNLIMGKEEKKFSLRPTSITNNKTAIIEELQKMYNNVNSTLVTGGQKGDWNRPYTEITAITPEGVKTREWKNYQSYLLSSKNPDGSARNANTIPLTTRIRPLKNAEDTNRKGIYFTVVDKKGNTSQEVTPTPTEKKVVVQPSTPEGTKKEQPVKEFDLTTKGAENIFSSKLGDIPFVIDIEKFKETDGKQGISLPDPATDPKYKVTLDAAITKLSAIPSVGITEETSDEDAIKIAENIMRNLIMVEVNKQLAPAPKEEVVVPVQSTFDSAIDQINKSLGKKTGTGIYENSPKIIFEFDGKEPSSPSYLTEPITKEGEFYRIKTSRYNVLIDDSFNIIQVTSDKGKVYTVKENELSTVDIQSPLFEQLKNVSKEEVKPAPTPETPVSDIEAKKADIEKTLYPTLSGSIKLTDALPDGIYIDLGNGLFAFADKKAKIAALVDKNNNNSVSKSFWNASEKEWKLPNRANLEDDAKRFNDVNYIDKIQKATDTLNAKYDAELAALEGAKPAEEVKPSVAPSLQDRINQRKQAGSTKRGSNFRLMLAEDMKKLKPENWAKVEEFLKATFPNIPVYRVKNYIKAANGRRSHGMFEDGAIYLSETAEVGTIYHEVFHAIWQALTSPEERTNIANEFRSRDGVFFDRASLSNIKYSEATDKQMEERLAEEIRDYFQEGKIPQKPAKAKQSWIAKLFSDIANFFKTFFTGEKAKSNTEKLFEKIGSGYFKQATPYDSPLSFAKMGFINVEDVIGGELADYSLDVFTGEQVHDIMQHMTYITVRDLFEENKGLFEIVKENKADVLKKLQNELGDLMADNISEVEKMVEDKEATAEDAKVMIDHYNDLYEKIMNEWENLTEKFEEYIKSYSIEFDENDEIDLGNDEKSKDETFVDARKIDNMRKTNAAVKLLLASLPVIDANGSEKLSSIGGYTLLPMSEPFMGVMNNVHTSRNMTDLLTRLKAMSEDDPKYIKLYNRLSKLKNIEDLTDEHDLQLLSAFWRSFKKQSPDVKTVYILDNGDIQVGDANFTTAARQVKEEFLNSIKEAISKGSKYFKKGENGKSYIGNSEAITDTKLTNLAAQVSFMKELGIDFDLDRLSVIPERTKFAEAVNGIRTSIAQGKSIVSVGGRTLDIDLRLRQLSEIKAKMDNPEFNSTYYNVNGELTQTFIGTNAASDLYNTLSQISNLRELENTQYAYLLTDSFAKNSVLLYKMFDRESGDRIEGTENIFKTGYADGVVNQKKGKQTESSKLSYRDRLVQEINLNHAGYYLSLVPGDASIGWNHYMGNVVDKSQILSNYNYVHDIFRGYLEDEIALAKENRPVAEGRTSSDLRFFKSILNNPKLQEDILSEETMDDVYKNHGEAINTAIDNFIDGEVEKLKTSLMEYGILTFSEDKYTTKDLAFGKEAISEKDLNTELAALSINFAINNIEFHKLLYSDPYQYSDELKRIKNFLSPRQAIVHSSPEMNTAYNKVWNKGFEEGDPGHTDFERDYFRAATLEDTKYTSDLKDYGIWKDTDGSGIIILKAHRNFKIRAGEWDGEQEKQYRYEVAWEKRDKKQKLSKSDRRALEKGNPGVKRMFTPVKPIVSGNKANGRSYNDVVLDKFALYPLSYRIMKELNPTSNAIKLYNKMQAEDVDYVVFNSGRKVGAENSFKLYKDGKFNEDPFTSEKELKNPLGPQTVLNIPFAIMSIQSDVPSKDDDGNVTRGSQMTKLATLDMMQAGVPIDFQVDEKDFGKKYAAWNALSEDEKLSYKTPYKGDNLYKEIKTNQEILEALVEEGIHQLTSEFGLISTPQGYKIESIEKVADALKREITKREVNDNISAALKAFKNGDTFLEATPAYQQIRNILYSIADRNVMSPKMNGGMKVQIPSRLLESGVTVNKNGALTSDVLKFYEDKDGKRTCEIMVGRWFQSDKTDEELLEYLNNTEEGQKILAGVAFRIPTQKQNSIDSFVVKKFLPREFGDSVVIPSELLKKSGSDFDIDKLNIYFKNVDVNEKTGEIRLIPYQGTSAEVRDRFKFRGDFKKSLENGYIQSLQNLTSHPLNFKNLVKPNSADQLKDISGKIVEKLGLGSFDYNDPGNMLSRRFMSRLRHAFVTGKYAIGIAAVNQTNHSLNQRQPIYIDMNRNFPEADKKWLGDGKIRFDQYNSIEIDGKSYPTLSMIENAAGDNISDILGQMIDGYVDISKDTWIIEMGITPNVASTWMLLVKLGVPIESVAYFMNQPIIRDYLRELEKKGSTWLFDNRLVKSMLQKYKGTGASLGGKIPSDEDLYEMIGKKTLNGSEKSKQTFILGEFLKYAKMAQHLFYVTQGTNFDTATFNDPFLLDKKMYMLDKARNTIFSSADKLLENSFLGELAEGATDVREAISQILKMDSGRVRTMLKDVLTPYFDEKDRDFIRISQRAVTTLIDWAVQTESNLTKHIDDFLISKEKNVARRITDFIASIKPGDPLYKNPVVQNLKPNFADPLAKGEVNNLYFKNKTNKVYDQNQIIYGFKELKNYLKSQNNIELYNDLVTLSVLQSGLAQSNVSFTSLLPYEDVKELYNGVIGNLPVMSNLDAFKSLNVFERTFWNYDDIVPTKEAEYRVDWMTGFSSYNDNMKFRPDIWQAMKDGDLPILLRISESSREAQHDVIVYKYEKEIPGPKKREMRAAGDYSYVKKGLFKKVGLVNGQYIYKAINAWGDGLYAKEFYSVAQKSKIDNGFIEADETITDKTIMSYFGIEETPAFEEEEVVVPTAEQEEVVTTPTEIKEEVKPAEVAKEVIGEKIVEEKDITKELKDSLYKANFEPGEYKVIEINGVQVPIDLRYIPKKINKTSTKFYGTSSLPGMFIERYGKRFVIPGFEDIDLMIEQGTNRVTELSTGHAVSDTLGKTQKVIKEELASLFKEKNVRDVIARSKKIDMNKSLTNITYPTFEKSFSSERQKEIIANFTAKHKLSEEQAMAYIKNAIATKGQTVIDKLNECY